MTYEGVASIDVVPAADRRQEHRLAGANIAVALVALSIGVLTGLLQALEKAGIDLYPAAQPFIHSYYQGLTAHGVLNVLVFTIFFNVGFIQFIAARGFGIPLASLRLGWITFAVMTGGLVLAAIPLLGDAASVMFTFYLPLKAHWAFYVGLTLVVVGTWLCTANLVMTYRRWRRANPTAITPLVGYMSLVTFVMWTIASLGLALLVLTLAIPLSLGLMSGTDPLLGRTLFWFTGHPIVYFWLLPAYVSWYTIVPSEAGGRLFSDPMARVAFLMFLLLSTPVGLHHQFTDPGIGEGWKVVHGFFTFAVFFPSLLTFFTVVASLESAGRARGGRGWFRWFFKLPWGNPSLTAQVGAMFTFAFGGVGGLINASLSVNLVVHNTSWVPGHLHLTVGTAVALTFMGITYWLVPHLSGSALFSRWLALTQAVSWVIGMYLFSHSMHSLGIMGMPRRTAINAAPYKMAEWSDDLTLVGIGGTVLFVSALLYFANILLTVFVSRKPAPAMPPFAKPTMPASPRVAALFDRWWLWLTLSAALILLAYAPTLLRLWVSTPMDIPGLRVW